MPYAHAHLKSVTLFSYAFCGRYIRGTDRNKPISHQKTKKIREKCDMRSENGILVYMTQLCLSSNSVPLLVQHHSLNFNDFLNIMWTLALTSRNSYLLVPNKYEENGLI